MFIDIGFSPVPVMIEGFLLVVLQGRLPAIQLVNVRFAESPVK